jgi:hypothetical protein
MSRHYGVICGGCEKPIVLGDAFTFDKDQLPVYAAPLDPIPCKECGFSARYSKVIEFEVLENPR